MAFAPDWVLESACSVIAKRFIIGEMPLEAYSNRFARSLSERYTDTSADKLIGTIEGMMHFMATIEGDNVLLVCDSFTYNRVSFDNNGSPRKIKSLFRSALAPQKIQSSADSAIKAFRSFVFRLRSDSSLLAPKAWDPSTVQDLDWLADIYKQQVRITDSL